MNIDISQALSHKTMGLNKPHRIVVLHLSRHRKSLKERNDFGPVPEATAGEFARNERMTNDKAVTKKPRKPGIALAQMPDPDGGVYKHHPFNPRVACAG